MQLFALVTLALALLQSASAASLQHGQQSGELARRAPPPVRVPKPAPKVPETKTRNIENNNLSQRNRGSAVDNQGLIANSLKNSRRGESCRIMIGTRDLAHLERRAPESEQHKDPSKLHWTLAKTTTNAEGETFYQNKCYCGCKRSLPEDADSDGAAPLLARGVQIADIHARAELAELQTGCSIVGVGPADVKKWRGTCDKSFIGGRPVKDVLQPVRRDIETRSNTVVDIVNGQKSDCTIKTTGADGSSQEWTGPCEKVSVGGKPVKKVLTKSDKDAKQAVTGKDSTVKQSVTDKTTTAKDPVSAVTDKLSTAKDAVNQKVTAAKDSVNDTVSKALNQATLQARGEAVAQLQSGCSIVSIGADKKKEWRGTCDKSFLGGKPIKDVLPGAPARRELTARAEAVAQLQPGCSVISVGAAKTKKWRGSCDKSFIGGKPIKEVLQPDTA